MTTAPSDAESRPGDEQHSGYDHNESWTEPWQGSQAMSISFVGEVARAENDMHH